MFFSARTILFIAWIQATVATIGSLFFSLVMKFPPCDLCWYQRIFMFPLVLLIPVGIWKKDPNLIWYTVPLATLGFFFALFQTLLTWGLITDKGLCEINAPCNALYINWLGFITIPLLSAVAFLIIIISLLYARKH